MKPCCGAFWHFVWLSFLGEIVLFGASAEARFGFTGPEIFPVNDAVTHLRVADLNGDGWNDLVAVNNNQSKIQILYNVTGQTNRAVPRLDPGRRELNDLPPDSRFRIESIPSEMRVASMIVKDLNGDQRPDIACFGEPRELLLFLNTTNGWSQPRRWPADAGQVTPNGLEAGDLNGDDLTDLLLLAEDHVLCWKQRPDHSLAEPERIPYSGTARSVQVIDINGDKRDDLLLVNWEDKIPFRIRLQREGGYLGPELYFSSPPIRSYWADSLEPGGRTQLITIAQNSGRAQVSDFRLQEPERITDFLQLGQMEILPLQRTRKASRGMLWGDLDMDGMQDLAVAEPELGQVSIYFQQPDGSLSAARAFPTLAGVTELALADWDEDGKPELFLLSTDERAVGFTVLDAERRLPFPKLIPLEGRPLALAVGKLRREEKPVVAIVIDSNDQRFVAFCRADSPTVFRSLNAGNRSVPSAVAFHDADQDGLMDLVILAPYERIKILRQTAANELTELDVPPPGGVVDQPWLAAADLDGDQRPELLLPQRNFVRGTVLRPRSRSGQNSGHADSWSLEVKEQVNGAASDSRLSAATMFSVGSNAPPALFLLDTGRKALSICERDSGGLWQVRRNIQLPVSDFSRLESISSTGRDARALSLLGLNLAGVLRFSGQTLVLSELDGYETPIKGARLTDVISGDLDNDGRKDLVFLETGRNYIDIVVFDSKHRLRPANRWPVFEERTFRGRGSDYPEPREAVVAEVTGDGKSDLVVLVHDRILLYPQD